MIERIVRKGKELLITDTGNGLEIAFYRFEKGGVLAPKLNSNLILKDRDITFFAGQLTDPSVLDPTGKVDLKEPYPFIVRVRWENMHRILSFISWKGGETVESIRLSPLESFRVGEIAKNTALINHLIQRLVKRNERVNRKKDS